MEATRYIYKIVNSINSKIYIGKTIKSLDERFAEHITTAKRWAKEDALHKPHPYQSRLYPAMNKYGYNSFYIEAVEEVAESVDLESREQYWISFFNSQSDDIGYNISPGGKGGPLYKGHKHSIEARQKISKVHKGRKQPKAFIEKRTKGRIRQLQNLTTGEVVPATKFKHLKLIPQAFIQDRIYRTNKQFFINLGAAANCKSALTKSECEQLLNKLNEILTKNKEKSVKAMQNSFTKNYAEVVAKITAASRASAKKRQQEYWDAFIKEHKIDVSYYKACYEKYRKECPNRHLELIFKIPYNQVRKLNNYLGLKGGGSGHKNGKVSI